MTVTKFLDKWMDTEFASSPTKTSQFTAFAREFKSAIKSTLPSNIELCNYSIGHFYVSGFFRKGDTFVYFSIPDVRWNNKWATNILIRKALNEKDFSGGRNHSTALNDIRVNVEALMR